MIDGFARDAAAIQELGFPAFARGLSPLDTFARAVVTGIDVEARAGGVDVSPGDLVVGDVDGVVVVPRELVADVAEAVVDEAPTRGDARATSSPGWASGRSGRSTASSSGRSSASAQWRTSGTKTAPSRHTFPVTLSPMKNDHHALGEGDRGRAGQRRAAGRRAAVRDLVELLETADGERLVRFAYTTAAAPGAGR